MTNLNILQISVNTFSVQVHHHQDNPSKKNNGKSSDSPLLRLNLNKYFFQDDTFEFQYYILLRCT
jgi:hypothetical protein